MGQTEGECEQTLTACWLLPRGAWPGRPPQTAAPRRANHEHSEQEVRRDASSTHLLLLDRVPVCIVMLLLDIAPSASSSAPVLVWRGRTALDGRLALSDSRSGTRFAPRNVADSTSASRKVRIDLSAPFFRHESSLEGVLSRLLNSHLGSARWGSDVACASSTGMDHLRGDEKLYVQEGAVGVVHLHDQSRRLGSRDLAPRPAPHQGRHRDSAI